MQWKSYKERKIVWSAGGVGKEKERNEVLNYEALNFYKMVRATKGKISFNYSNLS